MVRTKSMVVISKEFMYNITKDKIKIALTGNVISNPGV